MTMSVVPIHEDLDEFRKRSGLSFDKLSLRASTSVGYLHRVMRGEAKPSRDFIIRLAIAMGLDVQTADDLICRAGYPGLLADL